MNTCLSNRNRYGEINLKIDNIALQTTFLHLFNLLFILKSCTTKEKSLAALCNVYPCEEEIQTWKYIIDICFQYKNHCQILHNISSSIYMPDILGTKQDIAALSKFLERIGIFTKNRIDLSR